MAQSYLCCQYFVTDASLSPPEPDQMWRKFQEAKANVTATVITPGKGRGNSHRTGLEDV